jgi:hypothetical protein
MSKAITKEDMALLKEARAGSIVTADRVEVAAGSLVARRGAPWQFQDLPPRKSYCRRQPKSRGGGNEPRHWGANAQFAPPIQP